MALSCTLNLSFTHSISPKCLHPGQNLVVRGPSVCIGQCRSRVRSLSRSVVVESAPDGNLSSVFAAERFYGPNGLPWRVFRNGAGRRHDTTSSGDDQRRNFGCSAFSTEQESSTSAENADNEEGRDGPSDGGGDDGGGGGGRSAVDWISSGLIFVLWAGLIYYAAFLAPNQTPYRDTYFIQKLCGLYGDDGFKMNQVLVGEFFIMGLWPLVYTSLLIPCGRSKSGVSVGPFAAVSVAVGVFALLPYFGLWRPPPPSVSRDETSRWPLALLESKLTAAGLVISAAALLGYVGLSGPDQWSEFFQYFRESRFIHVMTIDFIALSTLCPFWAYNDLTVRRGSNSLIWSLAFLPLLGPAIYVLLRPSLPASMIEETQV